jgi:hypothetical protein
MSEPQTLSYESAPTTLSGVGLGTIALQIVGVYSCAQAIPVLTLLLSVLGFSSSGMMPAAAGVLVSFLMPCLYLVMGFLLIRFAPRIAVWLFRDSVGGVMVGPITTASGQYLQAIAFAVTGVVFMINAAPHVAWSIWTALQSMGARFVGFPAMIEPGAQFLLGLVLFLQSKGLSLLWHKIRAGGVVQPGSATRDEVAP